MATKKTKTKRKKSKSKTTLRSCIGLLALVALIISSGCVYLPQTRVEAEKKLDPAAPVVVELWHYYNDENQKALELAIDTFNRTLGVEHGVIVQATSKGQLAELEAAVMDSAKGVINSEPMPDIFSCYPDRASEIAELGKICNLDDYFTEEEKRVYVDGFIEDGILEDGTFAVLPIVKSTELIFVNNNVWEDFSAATGHTTDELATWEGVYRVAQDYHEWSGGRSFMGIDSIASFIVITAKQMGVELIDATNKQALMDREVLQRIFNIYYGGMCKGYLGSDTTFGSDAIKKGALAAYTGSSASAAYFPTWIETDHKQTQIDLLPLPYPVFENADPYIYQQGAGVCISKSTPARQEGAALFLKWFTNPGQNIDFAMTTGYLPVQKTAYEEKNMTHIAERLNSGYAEEQNVAKVYDIVLRRIIETNTYAPKPFSDAYTIRQTLQYTLRDLTQEGKSNPNMHNVDAQFEIWFDTLLQQLTEKGIKYTVK